MKLNVASIPTRCFWIGVYFSTLYLSYRYPFQINFSGTSPTYTDTPFTLQIGKFVIILLCSMVALPFFLAKKFSRYQLLILVSFLCVSIWPLVKASLAFDGVYADIAFWPLAALVFVGSIRGVTSAQIDKYFIFLFAYTILSTAGEVFLFLVYGRLPALAYSNSLSVRFGGFLDDPNGFAAIIFLLMPWAYFHFSGVKKLASLFLLCCCLILTQSLTALAFFALLLAVVILVALYRQPKRALLAVPLLFVCASVMVYFYVFVFSDALALLIMLKMPSINEHAFPWSKWLELWPSWIVFGSSPYQFYESWWSSALINFGLVWYATYVFCVASIVFSVASTLRRLSDPRAVSVLSGLLLFMLYVVAGSVNLPLFTVFPVNFMFFSFGLLVLFKKVDWEQKASPSISDLQEDCRSMSIY